MASWRSFQISAVFPHLTVLENVRVALQGKRGHSFDFWRSARVLNELNAGARELIAAGRPVRVRSHRRRRAALRPQARARDCHHARARPRDDAVLDEPTAGMVHSDVERITAPRPSACRPTAPS